MSLIFSSLVQFYRYFGKVKVDLQAVSNEMQDELFHAHVSLYFPTGEMKAFLEEFDPMAKIVKDAEWHQMLVNWVFNTQSDYVCRDCMIASNNLYRFKVLE